MAEHQGRLACAHVPDFDGEVARRRRQDVLGRGVEEDLSDLSEGGGGRGVSISCLRGEGGSW